MEEYETVLSKHGEVLIFSILENWERHRGIRPEPISTKERWSRFIRETNDNHAIQAKTIVSA